MRFKTGLFVLAAAGAAVLLIACTTQKAQALPLNNVVGSFNPDVAYTPRSGTTTKSVYGSTVIPKTGSSTSKNAAKASSFSTVKATAAQSILKGVPTLHPNNPLMVGPFSTVNAKTVSVNSYQTVKSVGSANAVSPVHTVNPYQAVDITKSFVVIGSPAPNTANPAAGSAQNIEFFGYYGHYHYHYGYRHYWGYHSYYRPYYYYD